MIRLTVLILLLLILIMPVSAVETAVKITPKQVYSTSKAYPQEGDYIEFVTVEDIAGIKKGTVVTGLLTEKTENNFEGKIGSFYIEQFKINGKNLDGIIYQKGNPHALFLEHIFNSMWVRGGEAFLVPDKDIFTLYLKE